MIIVAIVVIKLGLFILNSNQLEIAKTQLNEFNKLIELGSSEKKKW